MTNSNLKQPQTEQMIYAHPWYEELNKLESTTLYEFGLTLKPSEDSIGLKSIEWAAGLFEGEGCIHHRKDKDSWQLGITMTDQDVMEAVFEVMGVGSLRGPYKKAAHHHKPYYQWRVYSKEDIFKVICDFYPYMGERRREKFDEFLSTYNG